MANAAEQLPIRTESQPNPARATPRLRTTFNRLKSDLERLLDDFTPGFWNHPLAALHLPPEAPEFLAPAIDIIETQAASELTAEMPGIPATDIEVKLNNGRLTIRGEKSEAREEHDDYQHYVSERRYGSFRRSFDLPDGVDRDRVEARFENGILTVVMPKLESARQSERKIDITAA